MARVVKRPVYGTLCSRKTAFDREDAQSESSRSSLSSSSDCSPKRRSEFIRYEGDSDEEADALRSGGSSVSQNFVDLVNQRLLGYRGCYTVDPEYGSRHLLTHGIFRERTIRLGDMNKVFCSRWLNDHQIVFGSKCNKLSVYDVSKRKSFSIPLLRSRQTRQSSTQCCIHSMAINPSKTVLATGCEKTDDVAFYSLPTFDPLAVGEGAHKDWMFDLEWLDDVFLVSGSRDTTIALWKLPNECHYDRVQQETCTEDEEDTIASPPVVSFKPLSVKKCKSAEKVRALTFNNKSTEIAALSLNGYIHLWKADAFKQVGSQKLPDGQETVCLSYQEERNVYAVGSRSCTTVLDARSLQSIQKKHIVSPTPSCGTRSVSFRGDILTIGTASGSVHFYDLRAAKYLYFKDSTSPVGLKTSSGWVAPDDSQQAGTRYAPAIYTHCYDESGTRLFAAGGPLAVERQGNYAAVWS